MNLNISKTSLDTLYGFFFRNFYTIIESDGVMIHTEDGNCWYVTIDRSDYPNVTGCISEKNFEMEDAISVNYIDRDLPQPRNCAELVETVQCLVEAVQTTMLDNADILVEGGAYAF